MDDEGTHKT